MNSFSFNRNYLELVDKVDIDEILENWLNWIISLTVIVIACLLKKPLFDFVTRITSFDRIVLKLADKVDIDTSLDEFETLSDQVIILDLHPFDC